MKDISEMPADLRSFFGGYGPQFHDGYVASRLHGDTR